MQRENSRGKGVVPENIVTFLEDLAKSKGAVKRCCLLGVSFPFSGHFSLEFVTLSIFPKRHVR